MTLLVPKGNLFQEEYYQRDCEINLIKNFVLGSLFSCLVHIIETTMENFNCDFCEKSYKFQNLLDIHKFVHISNVKSVEDLEIKNEVEEENLVKPVIIPFKKIDKIIKN